MSPSNFQRKPDRQVVVCSYCGREFDRQASTHMPFCSGRCQQLDLRNWLTESYGLPHEGDPEFASIEDNAEAE